MPVLWGGAGNWKNPKRQPFTRQVKFDEVKNKLQIENFTGETAIAVEQDFYAAMYLTNMVSLAKQDANEIIEQNNEGKKLKHEYKVNTNVLIGKVNYCISSYNYCSTRIFFQFKHRIIPIRFHYSGDCCSEMPENVIKLSKTFWRKMMPNIFWYYSLAIIGVAIAVLTIYLTLTFLETVGSYV